MLPGDYLEAPQILASCKLAKRNSCQWRVAMPRLTKCCGVSSGSTFCVEYDSSCAADQTGRLFRKQPRTLLLRSIAAGMFVWLEMSWLQLPSTLVIEYEYG